MPAKLVTAVLATFVFILGASAQDIYTVWSSVVFTRTGERTPVTGWNGLPTVLTPLGATQAYDAGAFLRQRYFGEYNPKGIGGAPIQGLSANAIDVEQVYIGTLDSQYTVATAQAFLQGFYPPSNLTTSNTVQQSATLPATNILANGTYVEGPLNGYQYPLIQTYGVNDPQYVFIGAHIECPAWFMATLTYDFSEAASEAIFASEEMYVTVGSELLTEVLQGDQWNYDNAWIIWDYLNYLNMHNASVNAVLSGSSFIDNTTGVSYLDRMKWYSDQQLMAWYGDLNAYNNVTNGAPFSAPYGSISTIAGNFVASQILGQLQHAIEYQGEYYKLNLLFGDFQPMMSFAKLADLMSINTDFNGMPDFASVAAFELWSHTDGSGNAPFPSEADLNVRFYFRNGTGDDYQAYPLFGFGPDMIDLSWQDFQSAMYQLVPGSDGQWCNECNSPNLFCAFWNGSDSLTSYGTANSSHHGLSPVIAGVIGALVSLAVAALIFAAIMLIAGLRFHRIHDTKKELGGYKGSQKLASDKDLIIPKGGATVSAAEAPGSPARGGHERVGSWELKHNEAGMPNIAAPVAAAGERRPSYENDDQHADIGEAPWVRPVLPDERV